MNLGEIEMELELILQDDSFDRAKRIEYINEAYVKATAEVRVPDLKRIGTFDTVVDQAYTSLSTLTGGFSGFLSRVIDADGNPISILANLDLLVDNYPEMDAEGEVEAVALEGATIWYQKIPAAAETLSVLYYKNPDTLSASSDTPSYIPASCHRKLLIHGAAYVAYDFIEDGIEGEKVNTAHHFNMSFNEENRHSGITKFREYVGKRRVNHISSMWSN